MVSKKKNDQPSFREKLWAVRKELTEAAMLEQMAEECSELTQALLKKARKLRNENYTPKALDEICENIEEEFSDVMLCSRVLYLTSDFSIEQKKLDRWIKRLRGNNE